MTYEVYTDGGYSISQGIGAFAYVVLCNGVEVSRYSEKITKETSNRAELRAIIGGVSSLPVHSKVTVYSDSQYALNVLSGTYNAKANTDLVYAYKRVLRERKYDVKYEWVKGHSGNKYNEICDDLCNQAAGIDLNDYKSVKMSFKELKRAILDLNTDALTEVGLLIEEELSKRDSGLFG